MALAWEEARTLLQAPNPHSFRGIRDRALLAVLLACVLRRGELSRMNCERLAMRDGHWVFLDFLEKGNKVRAVAVPRFKHATKHRDRLCQPVGPHSVPGRSVATRWPKGAQCDRCRLQMDGLMLPE